VNGTPAFFVNAHRHDGSFYFETLASAIHRAILTAKSAQRAGESLRIFAKPGVP
jgi:hypothetical protein